MFSTLPPIAMVTTGLVVFGYVAIIGGVVAFLGALVRVLLLRKLPVRLSKSGAEKRFLIVSFLAALLGSAWLFLAPAYVGSTCSISTSTSDSETTISRETEIGPNGETLEIVSYSETLTTIPGDGDENCKDDTATFYEQNGPRVIPLFTVPILFTLLPLIFYALRVRPIIEAFLAFLLGGQMAIGMSLYGAAFGPSAVFMLFAALAALRSEQVDAPIGDTE